MRDQGATPEQRAAKASIGGLTSYAMGVGVHGATYEQRAKWGKEGGLTALAMGVGVHAATREQLVEWGKEAGQAVLASGRGIHCATPEQRAEWARVGGEAAQRKHGKTSAELQAADPSGKAAPTKIFRHGIYSLARVEDEREVFGLMVQAGFLAPGGSGRVDVKTLRRYLRQGARFTTKPGLLAEARAKLLLEARKRGPASAP